MRRAREAEWGVRNAEVPLSGVCETEAFLWFASHLLAHLPRFREVHNAALGRYRAAYGIRSRHHPVPDLAVDGDWLEAPFWAWRRERPRRRPLLARQVDPKRMELRIAGEDEPLIELPLGPDREACCAVERLRELPALGVRLRTRALTTTMFARCLLGDLFIHGIGGAKYDELGDEISRGFFGVEPPAFLTLSLTLWPGLPDDPATDRPAPGGRGGAPRPRLQPRPPPARAVAGGRRGDRSRPSGRPSPGRPRRVGERVARYFAIRAANAALGPVRGGRPGRPDRASGRPPDAVWHAMRWPTAGSMPPCCTRPIALREALARAVAGIGGRSDDGVPTRRTINEKTARPKRSRRTGLSTMGPGAAVAGPAASRHRRRTTPSRARPPEAALLVTSPMKEPPMPTPTVPIRRGPGRVRPGQRGRPRGRLSDPAPRLPRARPRRLPRRPERPGLRSRAAAARQGRRQGRQPRPPDRAGRSATARSSCR